MRKAIILILFASILGVGVIAYRTIQDHISQSVADFSALWHTHDLIQVFAKEHGEMPGSWGELSPLFNAANAGYGNPDIQFLRDRIRLNLEGDESATWFLRVRSGHIKGEEDAANQRILATLQTSANSAPRAAVSGIPAGSP